MKSFILPDSNVMLKSEVGIVSIVMNEFCILKKLIF